MLEEEGGGEQAEAGRADRGGSSSAGSSEEGTRQGGVQRRAVTYSVGDTVVAGWEREGCSSVEDITIFRIYALFEVGPGTA
jgi:hypothetical protein